MRVDIFALVFAIVIVFPSCSNNSSNNKIRNTERMGLEQKNADVAEVPDSVRNYIDNFLSEKDTISETRKIQLKEIANFVGKKVKSNDTANLIFICTHNSRRSHLSQVWAQTAAVYYNIPNVRCYSGGLEATAFNYRSVRALRKAGFEIKQMDNSDNPVYHVFYDNKGDYLEGFSKKFSDKLNPQDNFAAIMTCNHADEACPIVPGADARFSIPYEDPKVADNTPEEEIKYDERCKQIAIEMFYLFSKVKP